MDSYRRRRYYNDAYEDGNTVKTIPEIPERDYRHTKKDRRTKEQIQRENRRIARNKRRRQERVQGIDLFSLVFLSAAVVITLAACVSYLRVQSEITNTGKKIAGLESAILELENSNDALQEQMDAELDLQKIYKRATKELGMKRAGKSQVITYDMTRGDYVRQYDKIPEGKNENILDKVIDSLKK